MTRTDAISTFRTLRADTLSALRDRGVPMTPDEYAETLRDVIALHDLDAGCPGDWAHAAFIFFCQVDDGGYSATTEATAEELAQVAAHADRFYVDACAGLDRAIDALHAAVTPAASVAA